MNLLLLSLLSLLPLATPFPQSSWPYRENSEYYGYQRNQNHYFRGSMEDDEAEGRQDLKVGQQPTEAQTIVQPTTSAVAAVETGSAKPVSTDVVVKGTQSGAQAGGQQGGQSGQSGQTGPVQPPAFPPATPPRPRDPPPEDSSEEDSEEEDDDEEDEEEDEDRRIMHRSDADVHGNKSVVMETGKEQQQQVVETLVPGYVTEQGEVLVPFDTVVGGNKEGVAVVEDPTFAQEQHHVIYYSDVPPPGAIFTFDDDNELEESIIRRLRRDSSEEEQDESTQDDSGSSEELLQTRPQISDDDEAESLRYRHGFYSDNSRSPNYFYNNGYYVTRYAEEPMWDVSNAVYYYRPASDERVKVTPVGSFDVSLEEREGGGLRAVVGPTRYAPSAHLRRPNYSSFPQQQFIRRNQPRPLRRTSRPINRRKQTLVALVEGGTPVIKQRNGRDTKDEVKKKVKKVKKEDRIKVKKDKVKV